jgi:signal transduction histidine kinase
MCGAGPARTVDLMASPRRTVAVRGWGLDLAAASLATAFLLLASTHIEPTGDDRGLGVLGTAIVVTAGASLALCRRRPALVLGVVTAALGAYVLRRYAGGPVFATGWIALFALSWRRSRRAAVIGAVALCSVLIATGLIAGSGALLLHLVFVGWSAAAVALGDAARSRRSYLTELEERARDLERTRDEEARRRVAEDRLRVARDLHDSVAHAMATINVQAGAAAHVVDREPGAAKEAFTAIKRASAEVLDELAAMLRLLRDDGEDAALAPTPGIEQMDQLVASMREARLRVTVDRHGELGRVPPAVGVAAYRIVQESLTNVLRHAPGASAVVTLRVDGGVVTVEVTDDGCGAIAPASTGAGVGIRGMRERAASTGGRLDAGPRPDGAFTVRATWPARP